MQTIMMHVHVYDFYSFWALCIYISENGIFKLFFGESPGAKLPDLLKLKQNYTRTCRGREIPHSSSRNTGNKSGGTKSKKCKPNGKEKA